MFRGVALASFGSWYFGGNTGQWFHSHQPSFVLPPSLKQFSGNVQFSKAIPFELSHSAATSGPTSCGVSLASVGSWYFGRIMGHDLHLNRPSFVLPQSRHNFQRVGTCRKTSPVLSLTSRSTGPNRGLLQAPPGIRISRLHSKPGSRLGRLTLFVRALHS